MKLLNEKYQGKTTFKVNKFSDMTKEEFEKSYTGIKKKDTVGKHLDQTSLDSEH